MFHAAHNHNLFLSDYNLVEFRRIAQEKFSSSKEDVHRFLSDLAYVTVIASMVPQNLISDPKDIPVLNAAITSDVDIIISGDKHFLALGLKRPKVMTASDYLDVAQSLDSLEIIYDV